MNRWNTAQVGSSSSFCDVHDTDVHMLLESRRNLFSMSLIWVMLVSWTRTAAMASQTSIPVPKIRRYVYWRSCLWIFMENIPGNDLKKAWPPLSFWNKLWVAWAHRGYVCQLRRVTLTNSLIPRPIDDSGHPLVCQGHHFNILVLVCLHHMARCRLGLPVNLTSLHFCYVKSATSQPRICQAITFL
jgi:hypothetical protein